MGVAMPVPSPPPPLNNDPSKFFYIKFMKQLLACFKSP